jgi:hypothetical protein
VGWYTSLVAVAGNPAISYYDFTNGDLKWATIYPDIAVAQAAPLTDGTGSVAFGTVAMGGSSAPLTFTITNTGSGLLSGLAVTKDGTNAADFVVSALSGTSIPAGTDTVTFTVTFTPGTAATAARTAELHIASNDPDETSFDIALTATGISIGADTDGDGLNDLAEWQYAPLGFDWQVSQPALVSTLAAGANTAGLYTPAQVQTLNLRTPLLQRDPATKVFTLTVEMEKTTDLGQPFTPFPMNTPGFNTFIDAQGRLQLEFSVPDDAAFFRLNPQQPPP